MHTTYQLLRKRQQQQQPAPSMESVELESQPLKTGGDLDEARIC